MLSNAARLFNGTVSLIRYGFLIAGFCLAIFSGVLWVYLPPLPEAP